ncbi:MAG: hypothetical protein NTV76_08655 [Pseudomonas sp.]|nr:hypothetical protein [Pseudomonas sp.]
MRLNRFFAIAAPIIMLLPLTAHAEWPKETRDKYMAQCTQAAGSQPGISPASAKSHCACGADKIASYPAKDLQALMDNKASVDLQNKALAAISTCKVQKK